MRFAATLAAAAGTLALMAGISTPAQATVTACKGTPVEVQGSSLQKGAQEFWRSTKVYKSENPEANGCGSSAPEVNYTSKSSGCGLDAFGAGLAAVGCNLGGTGTEYENVGFRSPNARIGATDFPPDVSEEKAIDNEGKPHAGKVHVIPVASAAVAIVVHFPEGCTLKSPGTGTAASGVGTVNDDASTGGVNDPTGESTGDETAKETLRVHIPAQALEEIWEHKITTWGAIPTPLNGGHLSEEMEGTPTGADVSYTCSTAPIFRVARWDTSGTTFNFKAYLSLLPSNKEDGGDKLWKEGEVGSVNTAWPEEGAGHTGIPAEVPKAKGEKVKNEKGEEVIGGEANECTLTISPNQICRANSEGGKSLAAVVNATDGSIGYLDLATAREQNFTIEANKKDDTYWLPLQEIKPSESEPSQRIVNPGVFYEPTADAKAHFNPALESSAKGANCAGADYRNIPTAAESPNGDPTLGNWEKAIATGGSKYPVCALTYDLAWDDYAAAYEDTSEQEDAAQTVKDYLGAVTSSYGQTQLPLYDYGVLPELIREVSQKGVAAIGFNKTAGNEGGKKEEVKPPAKEGPKTGGGTTVTPPSNSFSITSAKIKNKKIVISLELPGAGQIKVKASGGGVTVGSKTATVSGGQGTVTLSVSKAAITKIENAKGRKLKVTITVTFTPTGGSAATHTKQLTITAAEVSAKAGKGHKKGKKKK